MHKKTAFWLVGVALLIGLAYASLNVLNKPVEGTINQSVGLLQPTTVIFKDLKSKYFATKYPERYELQVNQNPSASLESWILLAHQVPGEGMGAKISVVVATIPIGGVKEGSAYKQFEAYPDTYTLVKDIYGNEEVIIATRTSSNFEQTALWAHGKYLATFSLTASEKTDQLISELTVILSNLVWL